MASVFKKRYSVQEYLALEDAAEIRSEYYRGEIFAMVGSTPNHVRVVRNLTQLIGNHLATHATCEVFSTDLRLWVESAELYTYPDLVVACEPKFEGIALTNPKIIVEVLSRSTESYDRGKKFDFYREIESLAEYVLVSQRSAQVERYVKQPDGNWLLTVSKGLTSEVDLSSIGLRFTVADVYRKVDFDAPANPDDDDPGPGLRLHPE